ncbi:MAG: hypothetical protein ACE5HP_05450 [Gemmatimonadota bacterium]
MSERLGRWLPLAGLWLGVGFASGTLVLLGPVRWTTSWLRARGTAQGVENATVAAIILAYVVLSFLLSWWIHGSVRRSRRLAVRMGAPGLVAVAAGAALFLWLSPGRLAPGGEIGPPTARFTFGTYPDAERLARLRELGYTAVIPLLHPAVVPFEPVLLERERAAAREVGIRLIHVPLLPWIGANGSALARLRRLATSEPDGRYYVHCYLGRDRVRLVERVVREAGASTVMLTGETQAPIVLHDGLELERGPVRFLADSVYLTPYPTEEELLLLVSNTGVRSVVSLLDPENPSDTTWIRREEEALAPHGIRYLLLSMPGEVVDSARLAVVVDSLRHLPRPTVVHGFRVPSPRADALLAAYR